MVSWLLFWVPVSVGVGVAALWLIPSVYAVVLGLSLCFIRFVWALWMPSVSFDRWGYHLDDSQLRIVSGVWFRRVTSIPRGRIQHVDTRQGPIEAWFGLTQLHIHTASGVGSDGVIPGLEPQVAESLRQQLLSRLDEDAGV